MEELIRELEQAVRKVSDVHTKHGMHYLDLCNPRSVDIHNELDYLLKTTMAIRDKFIAYSKQYTPPSDNAQERIQQMMDNYGKDFVECMRQQEELLNDAIMRAAAGDMSVYDGPFISAMKQQEDNDKGKNVADVCS